MGYQVPSETRCGQWLWRGAGAALGLVISLGIRRLLVGAAIAVAGTVATLTLTGTVPQVLDISVTPTAAATNLDLVVDLPRTKVADIVVETNSPGGYVISVQSQNTLAGDCPSPCLYSATTNQSLPFLTYRDLIQIGFSGPTAQFVQTFAASGAGGDAYDAGISYTGSGANLPPASNYGEVLTFSVAIN